jgi:hypothetical protein
MRDNDQFAIIFEIKSKRQTNPDKANVLAICNESKADSACRYVGKWRSVHQMVNARHRISIVNWIGY